MENKDQTKKGMKGSATYEAPAVERVLTQADLEREFQYAGAVVYKCRE